MVSWFCRCSRTSYSKLNSRVTKMAPRNGLMTGQKMGTDAQIEATLSSRMIRRMLNEPYHVGSCVGNQPVL